MVKDFLSSSTLAKYGEPPHSPIPPSSIASEPEPSDISEGEEILIYLTACIHTVEFYPPVS